MGISAAAAVLPDGLILALVPPIVPAAVSLALAVKYRPIPPMNPVELIFLYSGSGKLVSGLGRRSQGAKWN